MVNELPEGTKLPETSPIFTPPPAEGAQVFGGIATPPPLPEGALNAAKAEGTSLKAMYQHSTGMQKAGAVAGSVLAVDGVRRIVGGLSKDETTGERDLGKAAVGAVETAAGVTWVIKMAARAAKLATGKGI